jgi:hypothetical protein
MDCSANLCLIAPKLEIGTLNCTLSLAYLIDSLSTLSDPPRHDTPNL